MADMEQTGERELMLVGQKWLALKIRMPLMRNVPSPSFRVSCLLCEKTNYRIREVEGK